jgi:hypothetical protein
MDMLAALKNRICQMPPLPKHLQEQAERLRVIRQQQQQPSCDHVVKQAEKVARRQENASRSEKR